MYYEHKNYVTINTKVQEAKCTSFTETKQTKEKESVIQTTKTLYDCNLSIKL